MEALARLLRQHRDRITEHLQLGYVGWDKLIARLDRQERESSSCLADEQVWTFLAACGYAAAGKQGVAKLTEAMTGSGKKLPARPRLWLEVLPIPPRKRERSTHIDLALGTIALCSGTASGIELEGAESSWICFCEAKWHSDISTHVSHDPHRNQLARVIENAVCFQGAGMYAEKVHVTLLTLGVFRTASPSSRLYQYRFNEYDEDRARLADELNVCTLERRDQPGWTYPADLPERLASLSLRWSTDDELLENLPDSLIAASLRQFWEVHGNCQGRPL